MVAIQFPEFEKNVLPIVLLGQCYRDKEHSQHAEATARKLHGDGKPLQLTFLHALSAQPSALGFQVDGTVSDIYFIGREAAKRGWKRFIIFDNLTHFQLSGQTEYGRNKIPTAIVVALGRKGNLKPEECVDAPEFVITRIRWKDAFREAGRQATSRCAAPTQHNWLPIHDRGRYGSGRSSDGTGLQMILRDPLAFPFSDYEEAQVGVDELYEIFSSTQPALPPETVWQISEELNYNEVPLWRLSDVVSETGDYDWQTSPLPIICLAPLTKTEASNLVFMIGSRLQSSQRWDHGIRLIRWRHHAPANRRDMMRVYSHVLDLPGAGRPWLFLHELSESYDDIRTILIDSKADYPDVCVNLDWNNGISHLYHYSRHPAGEFQGHNHHYAESPGTVEYLPMANQTFPFIASLEALRMDAQFRLHVYISSHASPQQGIAMAAEVRLHGDLDGADAAHWPPASTTENKEPDNLLVSQSREKHVLALPHTIKLTCEHDDRGCNKYVFPPHTYNFIKAEGVRTAVIADEFTTRDHTVLVLEMSDGGELLHARIPARDAYDFGYQCGWYPYRSLMEWAEGKDVQVFVNNTSRGSFKLKSKGNAT